MRTSMQWLGLALLAALLLQTIAISVSFIYFSGVLSAMREAFSKSSISCLMRTNFRAAITPQPEEAGDDPCWQLTQQLHHHIEKTMSNHYEKEVFSAVKEEVTKVTPFIASGSEEAKPRPEIAAHVTGGFLDKADGPESKSSAPWKGQKIQAWEAQKGLAFLHNMEMQDGELVVSQPGLYYIYSQTYFRHVQPVDEEPEDPVRSQEMLQYIYKKTEAYPIPVLLMKNARTTCWSTEAEYGLYSIYQAGVAQLGTGDRLFVAVTNVSSVDMDEKSSFFGTFLVG